jgi:hypothetical protein
VVVGAAGEAPHPVGVAGAAAQHDRGQVGVDARGEPVGRLHPVEEGQPAAVLEPEVQHDQGRLANLDRPQRLTGAGGARDPESVRRQVLGQEPMRRLVVLHHQNQALLVHTRKKDRGAEPRPGGGDLGECRSLHRDG